MLLLCLRNLKKKKPGGEENNDQVAVGVGQTLRMGFRSGVISYTFLAVSALLIFSRVQPHHHPRINKDWLQVHMRAQRTGCASARPTAIPRRMEATTTTTTVSLRYAPQLRHHQTIKRCFLVLSSSLVRMVEQRRLVEADYTASLIVVDFNWFLFLCSSDS